MGHTREHPRLATPPNMIVFRQVARRGRGELANISLGGLGMRTLDRTELGAIDMTFKLPATREPLAVTGEVVRVQERPSGELEVGIRFHLVNPPAREGISQFMAWARSSDR
ncbi:MAG: PilZ domain-containing protein [Thermodesulfobacteriota bacterium]